MSDDVTILNVCSTNSKNLSVFIAKNLLNIAVPINRPNQPVIVDRDTADLLGRIANNLSFATELFNMVVSELSEWKKLKISKNYDLYSKEQIEMTITDLNAKHEILYRTVQTLSNKYEASSRQITVMNDYRRQ